MPVHIILTCIIGVHGLIFYVTRHLNVARESCHNLSVKSVRFKVTRIYHYSLKSGFIADTRRVLTNWYQFSSSWSFLYSLLVGGRLWRICVCKRRLHIFVYMEIVPVLSLSLSDLRLLYVCAVNCAGVACILVWSLFRQSSSVCVVCTIAFLRPDRDEALGY